MAGCCPPSPPSSAIGAAFSEANGPESDIRPGESVECYMARGGNTTGLHDDATENVLDKIENSSIPLSASNAVNVTFKLTAGSTRTPTSWSMTGTLPAGLTFSSSGTLTGTATAGFGQKFQIQVTATDGTGTIDTRGFTFSPSSSDSGNKIKLISPLPGAEVNSLFGPRMHPIHKVMKPHTGIDMRMENRSVKDVVAAADGTVTLCGGNPSSGYGLRVMIKHSTASGSHLCTTTYNHLNQIYVKEGQKVMAGQKIALEGTTGASTGNHLHFECVLPDGKFIDPLPLIAGPIKVATKTLPNGEGDPASKITHTSDAVLSKEDVQARQNSCQAFGSSYPPSDPPETTDPVPVAPSTDPFELAWFFVMTQEVGPHWGTSAQYSPGDSELEAGLHETKAQQKKTGYVNSTGYPGGETKFGVAQKPNPRTKVDTMSYALAKQTGFNNYWNSPKMPCSSKSKLVSIMLMDMNYLHGEGNSRKIYQNAAIVSSASDSLAVQQQHIQTLYDARVAFIKAIPRPEYTKGWLNRAKACLEYCKSAP